MRLKKGPGQRLHSFLFQGQDLATGNLTAPAIFALQSSSGEQLRELIDDEFSEEGSLDQAIAIVNDSGGIAAARKLAAKIFSSASFGAYPAA